jgi:hypothetical protein
MTQKDSLGAVMDSCAQITRLDDSEVRHLLRLSADAE